MITEKDLEPGDVICNKCNGNCKVKANTISGWEFEDLDLTTTCPKCHGHGKLDWIENINGEVDNVRKMTETLDNNIQDEPTLQTFNTILTCLIDMGEEVERKKEDKK